MIWLDLIDLGLLAYIAYMERKSLAIDRANNLLFADFFNARRDWYRARSKPKKVELPPESSVNELVLLAREIDGEQQADGVLGDDRGEPGAGPGNALEIVEPEREPSRG